MEMAVVNRGTLGRRVALGGFVASTSVTQLAFGQTTLDGARDETLMKVGIEFNGASMTATLCDNASARDFASMLPLDLAIDDYSTNEKVAYLPRKLTEEGSGPLATSSAATSPTTRPGETWLSFMSVIATPAD